MTKRILMMISIAIITIAFIGLIKWFKSDSVNNSNYDLEINDTIASHIL